MKTFFQTFSLGARGLYESFFDVYDGMPPALRRTLALGLLLFCLVAATLASVSCATSPSGLAREQVFYQTGTNIVAQIASFVPYVPAPMGNVLEIFVAIAGSALAAWNLHQQGQLKRLRDAAATGPPPAGPQPSAQPTTSSVPAQ